jgi:hypothetical protein
MRHEARHEGDVAGEPVELRHNDRRALALRPGSGEGRLELRPAIESVSALSRLNLGEGRGEGKALSLGEAGQRGGLPLEPEPGAALLTLV